MKNVCEDCGISKRYHIANWVEGIFNLFGNFEILDKLPSRLKIYMDKWIENIFIFSKLLKPISDFKLSDLPIRFTFFVEQAQQRGYEVSILKGPFGFTNFFRLKKGKKIISIEGLPNASFLSKKSIHRIDDKDFVKKELAKHGIPVPEGEYFSIVSKKSALRYGKTIGYPLVVKPRYGSLARHVTLNISNRQELIDAINKSLQYEPCFMVEKYLEKTQLIRATVVDFDNIALAMQIPPNVVGDGIHSIKELVDIKNLDPARGERNDKSTIVYTLATDDIEIEQRTPRKGERVFLRKEPFLRYGADIENVTDKAHPDNRKLFQAVAKLFSARLVGMDFLCEDIAISYKNQRCGILELNSLPCVAMHHGPTLGKPIPVSAWLLDMMEKYA